MVIGGGLCLGQKSLGLSLLDLNLLVEEFDWVSPFIGVLASAECLYLVSLIFMFYFDDCLMRRR